MHALKFRSRQYITIVRHRHGRARVSSSLWFLGKKITILALRPRQRIQSRQRLHAIFIQEPHLARIHRNNPSHEQRGQSQRLRTERLAARAPRAGEPPSVSLGREKPRFTKPTNGVGGLMIVSHESRIEIVFVLFLVILSAFSG
jgi:hypothetical protein|tara:strand:+ start:2010 stop:2441 length:432 start_codon:yes stop_codon:yes gene_type:complete